MSLHRPAADRPTPPGRCRPRRDRRRRSPGPVAGTAKAAKAPVIGPSFFGVHHQGLHADGPIGWPQAPVGSVRMWDNYVSWRELEVAPGVFDWTLIDAEMAKAREHGTSVLWSSARPRRSTRPGHGAASYGPGASAMPTRPGWIRVRACGGPAQPCGLGRHRELPGVERGQRGRLLERDRQADGRR